MPYLQTKSHPETPGGHEFGGILVHPGASQVALAVKNLPASAGDIRDVGSSPWVTKISWRKVWQPPQVFLPGESHGQRSLAGYSPWGCTELESTE